MFTVLIAEKQHIDAIREKNKLFFEPFLENKELALCHWNPEGQRLQDAVPGLLDAVGRKKEWRAVILNNCTMQSSKKRNPFDVIDYSFVDALQAPARRPEPDKSLAEWEAEWQSYYESLTREKEAIYRNALEFPFQKLSTWLCFRPEDYILNDVREKQDVHDWAMEVLGRDERNPGIRLEMMERKQYKQELRMKEQLRRALVADNYLNIAYPTEVHCISLRSAENNYFDPDAYWNIRQENEYSAFADRNMYFDRMRFMVFDLLPPTHRNFRTEYIRFLASTLVFASNPVPGSAMQARRLYRLEAETDDAPLFTLVTSYDKKLSSTFDVIENEMERIRSEIPGELTDKAAEELFCTPVDVPVLLDETCDADKVLVENDYGLFYDQPENEDRKWSRDSAVSKKALAYIAKQQSRAIRKSLSQMHFSGEISDVNVSRLTPLQIEDIREYTNTAENEMVDAIPPDLRDVAFYTRQMDEEAAKVKKNISRRMTAKTGWSLSAVCLGLYLICFMPFIFSNEGTSKTIVTALILSISMLGVLAVIMLITLFFLRSAMVSSVRDYNNTAREIMNEIQSSMNKFAKYLSAASNVRRGHAVQNYAKKNLDEYTRILRIRKRHQEDIRKRRAQLAEDYGDYLRDRSYSDETLSRPFDYDFDLMKEYDYPAQLLAGDHRQIEFVSNGNLVTVPFSYITRILVRMEEIYEK